MVQSKFSTACTVVTAYKVAKLKCTKTLSTRKICHNILNVWYKCGNFSTLFVRVNTGVTENAGMETRDSRKVTLQKPETDTCY